MLETFGFGQALVHLKAGQRVARSGWNGNGMWLALETPGASNKMTLPFFYMSTNDGHLIPTELSDSDVLGADWSLV